MKNTQTINQLKSLMQYLSTKTDNDYSDDINAIISAIIVLEKVDNARDVLIGLII